MPTVSRWTIRAAALSMALGLLLWNVAGVLATTGHGVVGGALSLPALHLLVVGGLTQMIFGVAWWLFPVRAAGKGRGHPAFAWSAFAAINLGSLARVAGSLCIAWSRPAWGTALLVVAAVLLPLAAICFAFMILGRLRGPAPRRGTA